MNQYARIPLGEICTINPSARKTECSDDTTVSFVPMAAVDEREGIIAVREERLFAEVAKGYTSFKDGDILFAKITPCMENGKVALVRGLTNGIGRGSTEFYVLRPREKVLGEYIYYFVRQPQFREEARKNFTGTVGQKRVPKLFMQNILIPLPPLHEQRRIVDILDRASKIERLQAQAQERLREFIPALFVKMFGDPVTNPMEWEIRALGDLCDLDRQGLQPGNPVETRLPFVGVENVESVTGTLNFETDSRVGSQKSTVFLFDKRHILYGKLRPYLNKVATPDFSGRCSTELVPLLPRDGVDRDFVAQLLRREETVAYAMASATGARMPRADMKALMSMPVPVPPFHLQRRFTQIIKFARSASMLEISASCIANGLMESLMFHFLEV